jgi:hypothetical protein
VNQYLGIRAVGSGPNGWDEALRGLMASSGAASVRGGAVTEEEVGADSRGLRWPELARTGEGDLTNSMAGF